MLYIYISKGNKEDPFIYKQPNKQKENENKHKQTFNVRNRKRTNYRYLQRFIYRIIFYRYCGLLLIKHLITNQTKTKT